ncbi:MAG TPA: hypothetical protein VEC39_20215 [Vicinamibacterales bacterium]|nr:hypothetical protein [Vicinamibacterales bacterium]
MASSKCTSESNVDPVMIRIARAVSAEDSFGTVDPKNVSAALIEFAHLASISVLTDGVIASDTFRSAIDHVARRHFGRRRAEKRFARAVGCIAARTDRDAIEIAHAEVLEIGELAHYYAGLATGLTFADRRHR